MLLIMYSPFTQTPSDDLYLRNSIKHTGRMNRVQVPAWAKIELYSRTKKLLAITVHRSWLQVLPYRVSRMKVYRKIEFLHSSLGRVVVGCVEVHFLLGICTFARKSLSMAPYMPNFLTALRSSSVVF
jgi:hypothetical protein